MREVLLGLLGVVSLLFAAQPDNLIRNRGESAWIGQDVYGGGIEQQAFQAISFGDTAIFEVKIENDGPDADVFTVISKTVAPGWTFVYYDSLEGGNNITAQITGLGWTTPSLEVGDSVRIKVEMIPTEPTSPPAIARIITSSTTDSTDIVGALAVIESYQPDNLIKNSNETQFIGDDIYNTEGVEQTKSQSVGPETTAIYHSKVENDGTMSDIFKVTASQADANWTVVYYDSLEGGNNITAQITGSGWDIDSLTLGGFKEIRVEVTPNQNAKDSLELLILTASKGDTSKKDAVKAVTKVKEAPPPPPSCQPDLLIKNPPDTGYIGDGIYNTDGTNQAREQTVYPETTAIYHIKIENDGESQDSFRLKGPSSISTWGIKYFDSLAGGSEITTDIITTGWVVALDSAGHKEIRLEATPLNPDAGSKEVLILATSLSDTSKKDAVKAATFTKIDEGIAEAGKPKFYEFKVLPGPVCYEVFYSLPVKTELDITIFNTIGKKMRVLKRGIEESGEKIILWDKRDKRGRKVGSGIYFVRFATPGYTTVRKLTLIR